VISETAEAEIISSPLISSRKHSSTSLVESPLTAHVRQPRLLRLVHGGGFAAVLERRPRPDAGSGLQQQEFLRLRCGQQQLAGDRPQLGFYGGTEREPSTALHRQQRADELPE
jgi:hypothetical protein